MAIEAKLNDIIQAAVSQRASDIYWLPTAEGYQILIQTTGSLRALAQMTTERAQQLMNHIKYRSNMAISDHRRPQLGAMTLILEKQTLNLRISAVGDFLDRESLVVRLLYEGESQALQYLIPRQRQQLSQLMHRTGLILFSGPMGAGKTSTMYDLVRQLRGQRLVMTIEDPVEIYEPQFLQLQVNSPAQMAYADLLKVGLRHHPDVFIIGEIRDAETAKIAVQAALSGHLVLSTIHARGVYGIMPRLAQLGVAPAVLEQALTAMSYQRLVPVTDGSVATIFDTVVMPHKIPQTTQMMTERWAQLIDEQLAAGRLDHATANQLKEA
ncbi:competence type IV pilus ATPase ComGA [Lactiplantibacillus paraplantarum]|uniref:Competence protein ComGA n=1 Tax=Lactiplantibacillus paraplantarum TaxID=60520 RepID=A0AAD0TQ06_9LACO|nr:competence type IV pilus ATPase ComGA [Lactiplantibacillus paraplantarum]AVW10743.1 secretion protein E [Lactiplantibacillus paraplantarum]AYJ39093.1 secretion protein E [Lactiplantibacillus paraplantarum]ERL42978.1 ComG operon protein 1 [Lactiplantibacillus paraplantarum]KRL49681.1 competence protein ComG [Lactiplantibacillus paraplantarum DSM 10667]MCU4684144.1 competence type IV pilus ATPase ComGA [Lactiplantibacillus paraplantarum]